MKVKKNNNVKNTVLGIIVLIILIGGAYHLLTLIGRGLLLFIKKLLGVVSSLDAVVIVALITGAVSILGVVISSIIGKIIEYNQSRRKYLAEKREMPYSEFIRMYYKILEKSKKEEEYSTDEMVKDMNSFGQQLTLWGSPNVVSKWLKFREASKTTENAVNNLFILEEIFNAMRKDVGTKRIKKGNLLNIVLNEDINKVQTK